jgi:hypothetical protein
VRQRDEEWSLSVVPVQNEADVTKEHLGDGLYADYSSGELWIFPNHALKSTDKICISGDVLVCLFKFIEKSLSVKITVKPKEEKQGE